MNYKYVIAFLGTKQQKDWGVSNSRLIIYDDQTHPVDKRWESIVSDRPDKWVKQRDGRLAKVDKSLFLWFQISQTGIYRQGRTNDLGQETNLYIYDTETDSIIFNNGNRSKEELESIFPIIEEFIGSGDSKANIPR